MACRKCRKRHRKVTLGHFLYESGLRLTPVTFDKTRILHTHTRQSAKVTPDMIVDVSFRDLAIWIKQGVNGITFLDTKDEAHFLAENTDIRKHHYD